MKGVVCISQFFKCTLIVVPLKLGQITKVKKKERGYNGKKPGPSSTPEQLVSNDSTQLIVRKATLCSPKKDMQICARLEAKFKRVQVKSY